MNNTNIKSFFTATDPLHEWINSEYVELAEDISIEEKPEKHIKIHRPLRVSITGFNGAVMFRARPLSPEQNHLKIWCGQATENPDWYQVVNQRIQNHEKYLRFMPGTYDLNAWTDDEINAAGKTEIIHAELDPDKWNCIVVNWTCEELPGERLELNTTLLVNGVKVGCATGIPHRLLMTHEGAREQHVVEGLMYWQRFLLFCGIELSHFAWIEQPLETTDLRRLSTSFDWQNRDELTALLATCQENSRRGEWYDACSGIRIAATDCMPIESALLLDAEQSDRLHYWHHEVANNSTGKGLACIPDHTKLVYRFDVAETAEYALVLNYQLLMTGINQAATISVCVDNEELWTAVQLKPTTTSGSLQPEANRFKAFPLNGGKKITLTEGVHELALSFENNNCLILDEILLTTDDVSEHASANLKNYNRPPSLEFVQCEQKNDRIEYFCRFTNSLKTAISGALIYDEASDPGPAPEFSQTQLALEPEQTIDFRISIPLTKRNDVRRVRVVYVDEDSLTRMIYYIRHRNQQTKPTHDSVLKDEAYQFLRISQNKQEQQSMLDSLKYDPELTEWLNKDEMAIINNPPKSTQGHGASQLILKLTQLAFLSGDEQCLKTMRAIYLGIAKQVAYSTLEGDGCEKRSGRRGGYGACRRGSIFGELNTIDLIAYDTLMCQGVLSDHDQFYIQSNLFWSGYVNSMLFMGKEPLSRAQAASVSLAIYLGILCDDDKMIQDGEKSLIKFGTLQIHSDGGHNEKISSYGASIISLGLLTKFLASHGYTHCRDLLKSQIHAAAMGVVKGCFSNGALLRQGDGGLQPSFHIFGAVSLLDYATELYPNDLELKKAKDLFLAQEKRGAGKSSHEPVEKWPEIPEELYRQSDCFSVSGWAILRSKPGGNRMEVGLDWSAFGDHGHPDKLNLNLFAFDEVLTVDPGYGGMANGQVTQQYYMRSVSHNTVVVDQQDQYAGEKGELLLFDHQTDVQVCCATAGRNYPKGVNTERCVILLDDVVIDLFRLTSGARHTYDYMFHCYGKLAVNQPLRDRVPFCEKAGPYERWSDCPGYEYLTDLKEAVSSEKTEFTWQIDGYPHYPWYQPDKNCWMEYKLGTLSMIAVSDSQTVSTGKAPFPLPVQDSQRNFVMLRKVARNAMFANIFHAHDGQGNLCVEEASVCCNGFDMKNWQAEAIKVQCKQKTIYVLKNYAKSMVQVNDWNLSTDAELVIYYHDQKTNHSGLHSYHGSMLKWDNVKNWQSKHFTDFHEEKPE